MIISFADRVKLAVRKRASARTALNEMMNSAVLWGSILRQVLRCAAAALLSVAGALAQTPAAKAPETSSAQSLLAQADEIFAEMSRITGLPIKGPLKKLVLSRPEIRKYLEESLHEEYTPKEIHTQEAVLKAFGLVTAEFDLEKFLITFYTEQAAGAYDPHRKTMFIADWPPPEMQRLVLAHELTHALQDQNFDLVKFLHAERSNDDATNARQAIMEGHATAAMLQRMLGQVSLASIPSLEPLLASMVNQQMTEFPAFTSAPYFFRLQALFPYAQGMGFMYTGLQRGGWETLNKLFLRPPRTTKEIFDPSFYYDSKILPAISLGRPPALQGAKKLHILTENTFGELGYYSLFGQFISEQEAKTVATGWLGDRYIVYEGPADDQFALVARTRWASPETALAFFRDYHAILAKKYPELTSDKRSSADLFVGTAANGQVILFRHGADCLWAEGVPAERIDAMVEWLQSF
jgi:hypothetical protein